MIRLEGIEKSFGERKILCGIDLQVARGEFLAVTGSSGSGKSTLLNLIGGMDIPDKGSIAVEEEEITKLGEDDLTRYRRKRVGFVFQFFNLLPNITVRENIRMPLMLNAIENEGRVQELLERFEIEAEEEKYPYQLSGGQQQRVAIARALVHNPSIILADEPTGSLDSRTGGIIMDLLRTTAAQSDKTIVLVTHERTIAEYADRSVKIRDGVLA